MKNTESKDIIRYWNTLNENEKVDFVTMLGLSSANEHLSQCQEYQKIIKKAGLKK